MSLLAVPAKVFQQPLVDEAGEAFDRHLPAARNHLTLHAAQHENPQRDGGDRHPQRAVGEQDFVPAQMETAAERGHLELVHRVDFA